MPKVKITPIIEPDISYRTELYEIYKSVFKSTLLTKEKKEGIIDAIFCWETWSWSVVGISFNALKIIKENDFRGKPKGLVRGHIIDRAITRQSLLERLFERDEWWQKFWGNDETELVTREENDTGKKSTIISFDCSEGLFANDGKVGFKFRKTIEGERCRTLWEENSSRIILDCN
jgi:hypothetical protein